MEALLHDIRFAVRQLAVRRGFTAIVILTLTLGTGATTTCFSLLSAFALRPLPFADPDRLVSLQLSDGSGRSAALTADTLRPLLAAPDPFTAVVAYSARPATVAGTGAAERVLAAEIEGDLFGLLGVPVPRGRFTTDPTAATGVVVSHALWARRFESDPGAIGQPLTIDGAQYVVTGVAGPHFSFPRGTDVWFPAAAWRGDRHLEAVGRLRPGVSEQQAGAALRALPVPPGEREGMAVRATSLRDTMIADKHRAAMFALLVASSLVLALACANLAGLLLAHVSGRRHEIAVRGALGASRLRLVRQLMTESLILALAGGALGTVLAQWSVRLFVASVGLPREAEWLEFSVDGRALFFALAASTLAALVFGALPAIRGTRVDIRAILQEDTRTGSAGPAARRMRAALITLQMAVSLSLVAGAASVVISSLSLDTIQPGFNKDRILAVRAALAGDRFDAAGRRMAFLDAAADRLRGLPGVADVTAVSHVPVGDRDVPFVPFVRPGSDASAPTDGAPSASIRGADAGYLAVMGIPLQAGRDFSRAEARQPEARVALVNDTMARRYWPAGSPLGARLGVITAGGTPDWYAIIGVVGSVAQRQLPAAPENQIYIPLSQARDVTLVVRSAADPGSLSGAAREAMRGVDPGVAISTRTMAEMYDWYTTDRRLQGVVLGALGFVALLVSALGIYGVMALMVTERNREIAIRKALGGSNAAVRRLVLGSGLRLASVGLIVGTALALVLTTFLSSIFYGARAFDMRVIGLTSALLCSVALAASWWPARAAVRIDPMAVLKR